MLRRIAAILATTAVLALGFAPGASAQQEPELESYGAGASGVTLYLAIADQELTISGTGAAVTSAPEAAAEGKALVTPLLESDGAPVSSTGERVEGVDEIPLELPAPLDLLGASIVRVTTSAEVADGVPTATSTSDDIVLDIISAELLGDLSEMLLRPLLGEALSQLDSSLFSQLNLPVGDVLGVLVDRLLTEIEAGAPLLRITVASTESTATRVEAAATSGVAEVTLLPTLLPIQLTVAPASASATYDPAADDVVLDGAASLAELTIGAPTQLLVNVLVDTLGQTVSIITDLLGPVGELLQPILDQLLGQVGDLLANVEGLVNDLLAELTGVLGSLLPCEGALAAIICIDGGQVRELDAEGLARYGFDYGEGTEGIEATALSVSVLDGLIDLRLGEVAAAANGELASTVAPPTTEPPAEQPPGPLPRTGGESGLPAAIAMLVVAGLGVGLLRRTRAA